MSGIFVSNVHYCTKPAADSESAKNSAIMSQRKKVCIIGGGSSGLIVMKELTLLGMEVICFERLPTIGGVYVKAYKNTVLTTSSLLTAWSDHSDGKGMFLFYYNFRFDKISNTLYKNPFFSVICYLPKI